MRNLALDIAEAGRRGWRVTSIQGDFQRIYESEMLVRDFGPGEPYHLDLTHDTRDITVNIHAGVGANRVAEVQWGSAANGYNWAHVADYERLPSLVDAVHAVHAVMEAVDPYDAGFRAGMQAVVDEFKERHPQHAAEIDYAHEAAATIHFG